jgi:hypothetical protein
MRRKSEWSVSMEGGMPCKQGFSLKEDGCMPESSLASYNNDYNNIVN